MKTEEIEIKVIKIADDRLKVDEKVVAQLMESIEKVGLLHPIVVCRPANQMGVHLVVGRGRLEAFKRLKRKTITARVEHGDTAEIRQWRELAEIDENLIRRDLSSALRIKLTKQRKITYEALHPDAPTGRGGARVSSRSEQHATPAFTTDMARKTGQNRTAIGRLVTQAKRLGDDTVEKIVGTSLDRQREIDALSKMDADERAELVERAARGEKVSARPAESTPGFAKLCAAWKAASPKGRKAFVKEYHAELAEIIG